jgi:hypothetical protein
MKAPSRADIIVAGKQIEIRVLYISDDKVFMAKLFKFYRFWANS